MDTRPGQSDEPITLEPAPSDVEDRALIHADVLAELERRRVSRPSWVKNLLILGITLVVFFQLGLLRMGVAEVAILVGVLLFHEAGHFAGMRLFGYRNVRMFFIPLLGAAVAGTGRNVPGWKRGAVTLMGPLPGIVLGLVLAVAYGFTQARLLLDVAAMLLVINGFNLLPVMPLDGGRLLQETIFSRGRHLEVGFRILAGAALVGGALLLQDWILGVLGGLMLVSVAHLRRVTAIARACRSRLSAEAFEAGEDRIPQPVAVEIIAAAREAMPPATSAKDLAGMTEQVWERLQRRPPGAAATLALLAVYLLFVLVPVATGVLLYTAASDHRPPATAPAAGAGPTDAAGRVTPRGCGFRVGRRGGFPLRDRMTETGRSPRPRQAHGSPGRSASGRSRPGHRHNDTGA